MILLQEKKSEALRTRDSGSVSSLAFRFVLCFLSKNYFAVSFLHVDSLDVMSFGAILVHCISRSRSTGFSHQLALRGHDMCINKCNTYANMNVLAYACIY